MTAQWSLHLECDNVLARDDSPGNQALVVLNDAGEWRHDANGTGTMSVTALVPTGKRSGVAYADIVPSSGSPASATERHLHEFQVKRP